MSKCPWCGGELNTYSGDYYEQKIANLKERLEAWRELAKSYEPRNYGAMTIAKEKLKDLGEL